MKRRPCFKLAGPAVSPGEFRGALNYIQALCFHPEDAGALATALEAWEQHTPDARLPVLRGAHADSVRELGAYWGALFDRYQEQTRAAEAAKGRA